MRSWLIVWAFCLVTLCATIGCHKKGTRTPTVAYLSCNGNSAPAFLTHLQKLGVQVVTECPRRGLRDLVRFPLWVLVLAPGDTLPEMEVTRIARDLERYVQNSGRLLCVVAAPPESDNAQGYVLNVIGERLGFRVLPRATRKPRNLAPEMLGNLSEIKRTTWSAAEIEIRGEGKTLIADEDLRPITALITHGSGQAIIVGHVEMLDENPDLTRNLFFLLSTSDD